jgi:hypothetical protein
MEDGLYYFNRCRRCNTMITKLQLLRAFRTDGVICSCGSGMFGPTNPLWHEWFTPRAMKMVVYKLLGLLSPAPEPTTEVVMDPTKFQRVTPLAPAEVRAPEDGE